MKIKIEKINIDITREDARQILNAMKKSELMMSSNPDLQRARDFEVLLRNIFESDRKGIHYE
jgi:hypothetical protein